MGTVRFWSSEKIDGLVRDYQNGMSYQSLAEKYKTSVASVRSTLYTLRKQGKVEKRISSLKRNI